MNERIKYLSQKLKELFDSNLMNFDEIKKLMRKEFMLFMIGEIEVNLFILENQKREE